MSDEIYEDNYLDFYDPDKCIGDLGEKWCTFKWRIYNLHLSPLETFQSPVFTTRLLPKTYWYLEVKISSPGNLRTIEISLHRLGNDDKIVPIVDVEYKIIFNERIKISGKRTFVYDNKTSRDNRYFSTPFYKSEKDYVTVECKLRPSKRMIYNVDHGNLDESFSVHLRKLLQSGEVCDTIIKVGNHSLMAHYIIIYARLNNLTALPTPIEDGKRIIKIDDLPVSVVKEMLKYAYTGQANLDLESVLVDKDILASYSQNFLHRCCWEDHPFATTFFNYETDSLSWNLHSIGTKSNVDRKQIQLLKLNQYKIYFSLDILESLEEDKGLTLKFKFCCEKMPKPTIVSCNYFLVQVGSGETFELGEFKTLLHSGITEGKVKLCSLLDIKRGKSTLCAKELFLDLKTDFKFCYGSSKSFIENLYEGQFNISQCIGCNLLRTDIEKSYNNFNLSDLTFKTEDGEELHAHKAILVARWADAQKFNVKENDCIVMKGYDFKGLIKFIRQFYTGTVCQ